MGATPPQLKRYVNLYKEAAHVSELFVFTVIPPLQFVMVAGIVDSPESSGYGALAADISAAVDVMCPPDTRVLVHVMSQNGTFAYHALRQEEQLMSKVVGVVFDSAPVAMTPHAIWKALKAATSVCVAGQAISFMKGLIGKEVTYEGHLQHRTERMLDFFTSGAAFPGNVKALFLYSKADAITDPVYIEDIIASAPRAAVTGHDFGTSGHTAHILHDPAQYRRCVLAFVTRVCGNSNSNSNSSSSSTVSSLPLQRSKL
jgi:hypothetical protein